MYEQDRKLNIGRDRRLSFISHKGSLDYSGRSLSVVSDVAEECISCYLRSYFYFNTGTSTELCLSDIDEETVLVDYESAHSPTTGKIPPTIQSHPVGIHMPNLLTALEQSSDEFTDTCRRCHQRRFFSVNSSTMQTAPDRLLGPGSSCRIPNYIFEQFSDNTMFLLTDFLKLQIDQGETEPVFGRAFLYNVHSRSRLSETFYFDTNSDSLLGLFTGSNSDQQLDYRELTTMSKTALFRISQRRGIEKPSANVTADGILRGSTRSASSNRENEGPSIISMNEENDGFSNTEGSSFPISKDGRPPYRASGNVISDWFSTNGTFLVIRVDKVLQQGDIGDIMELYNKEEKNKSKLRSIVYGCCQRLGRYRMPLAWTAMDLTALLIEARKTKISNESQYSYTYERSRDPHRKTEKSPESRNRTGQTDKRSQSVGPKPVSKRIPDSKSAELDSLSAATPPKAGASSNHTRPSSSADPFVKADVNITTFYRWEWDKPCDEELARCLSEMHRNTLTRLAMAEVNTRNPSVTGELLSGQSSMNGNPTASELLNPNPTNLKRLKTVPNLSLRLQLHLAEAFNLPTLLKLVGDKSQGHHVSPRDRSYHTVQSLPLLSPESLPYSGSFFHACPRFQAIGRIAPHATLDRLITRRQEVGGSNWDSELRPIREVLELPSPQLTVPFTSYRNLLYVYPRSVSFPTSRQGSSRNIAICIQLLCTDGDVTKALPAIFGKSNSPTFVKEAFTTVVYHNRSPDLHDEIKIQLPSQVDENLYLLFTFYHVSCQLKKVESTAALDSVIGYSWLPVMHQGTLCHTDVNLLISVMKPTPALAKLRPDLKEMSEKYHMDAFKWVDAHRELFRVSTLAVSSVYPRDAYVEMLLAACHPKKVRSTAQSFSESDSVTHLTNCVTAASLSQLVAFLVPLMDGLFRLLAVSLLFKPAQNNTNDCARFERAFSSLYLLCLFVERLSNSLPEWNDRSGRCRLLIGYLAGANSIQVEHALACHFDGLPLCGIPSLEELLDGTESQQLKSSHCLPEEFLQAFLISNGASDERIDGIPAASWWFFFEVLVRLLAEYSPLKSKDAQDEVAQQPNQPHTSIGSNLYQEADNILHDVKKFISTFTRRLILRIGNKMNNSNKNETTDCVIVLNRSLSHFLFDLMTITPERFILSVIVAYHRAINERIRHITSTMVIPADHWELEILIRCKLDLLRIVCSHERYLSLTGLVPTEPSVMLDRLVMEDGQVKCVQHDHLHRLIQQRDTDHIKRLNVITVIMASELEACMNLNSHKLQSYATSLLWNVLLQHESTAQACNSDEFNHSELTFNRLDKIAVLYTVLLDIGCQLVAKVVETWKAMVFEQKNRKLTAAGKDSNSMDDTSDKGSITASDGTVNKYHGKRRRTLQKLPKVNVLSHRFSPATGEVGLSESGKSTFVLLPEGASDSFTRRLSEPLFEFVCDRDAIQRWLMALLWIMRYTPEPVIRRWLRQLTAESRMRLVTMLYVIVNMFEYQGPSSRDLDRDSSLPTKFPADKRFYASLQMAHHKSIQGSLKDVPRDIYALRMGTLTESGFGSSPQMKIDSSRNRSNSYTPVALRSNQCNSNQPLDRRSFSLSERFASESALSVAEILDQLIWGLWEYDSAQGQPGHSLFSLTRSSFEHIVPYRKQTDDSDSCTLLNLVVRVQLFALSLNQSSASHSRFLLSLRHVITKFPSYLFEDSPELFAAATYHLLSLCASSRVHVRTDAVVTLYLLMRNHFVLTKNLVGVKTHLHTAFGVLFATSELRDNRTLSRPNVSSCFSSCGHVAKLRARSMSQIEDNLTSALTLLHSYAKNEVEFSDSNGNPGYASTISDLPNGLPPDGTNQAVHALFQAIEDDQICGFPVQVIQLTDNLRRLLGDVVRLQNKLSGSDRLKRTSKTSLEDSFSVIDLLHSIANRHRSCPELRLFWLMQITEKHYELSQFAEAAQCLCHCAAIVAEHLVNRGLLPPGIAPIGCADIAEAVGNMNLLEDSCICGPNGPGVNGICCPSPLLLQDLCPSVSGLDTAWYFSPAGWAALIAWTASAFAKADSHELVPRIYSRLIPVLETTNEYTRLAEVHGRIKEAYTALEKIQRGKRLFNAYFRVGFYGSLFDELNGLEFIYKEPPLTKLAEITQRLSSFYAEQFGEDRVIVVKDSKLIDQRTLDPAKAHLQITYVEPYFEDFELRKRKTDFQRNYALKRFVYCIPFTTTGAAHGSISEQFQRKYILTAARYFPYVKSRLVVVNTTQHILSPIEVALEDVNGRVKQLDQALSKNPVDVKFLQMVLQGGIGTTVNQGPLEVATTFLQPSTHPAVNEIPTHRSTAITDQAAYVDFQNRLRICFRQLLNSSYKALCVNRELIGPDQVEYHRELERNYTNVHNLLAPMLKYDPVPDSN